jgi:hypothetical protein
MEIVKKKTNSTKHTDVLRGYNRLNENHQNKADSRANSTSRVILCLIQ